MVVRLLGVPLVEGHIGFRVDRSLLSCEVRQADGIDHEKSCVQHLARCPGFSTSSQNATGDHFDNVLIQCPGYLVTSPQELERPSWAVTDSRKGWVHDS